MHLAHTARIILPETFDKGQQFFIRRQFLIFHEVEQSKKGMYQQRYIPYHNKSKFIIQQQLQS